MYHLQMVYSVKEYINFTKVAFPVPIFMKLMSFQQYYVQVS
jgi:hypothetical protein